MPITIIVEGKNDRSRLRRLLTDDVQIICTFGTPSVERLNKIRREVKFAEVFIFTDNDSSGKKIRFLLSELFADAIHIYTRRGYAGVEGTPDEYLLQQLDKHGLAEHIKSQG
jgi:toprim domain protein